MKKSAFNRQVKGSFPLERPAGSKIAKRARLGTTTLRDTNIMTRALIALFYNKRFASSQYSTKVL